MRRCFDPVPSQKRKTPHHLRERGEGLFVLILLLAFGAAFVAWLFYQKAEAKREGREFAHDTLVQLLVAHDPNYLAANFSPEMRDRYHAGSIEYINESLRNMGAPRQPFTLDGDIVFASRFFGPSGSFTAHLTYPDKRALAYLEVSQKKDRWQIDAFSVSRDDDDR